VKPLFWISTAIITWTYLGYPLWLYVRRSWRGKPVQRAPFTPPVSIVLAVRNEAANLPRKLDNLFALDYPPDRFEIIVVSDGSTDPTPELLQSLAGEKLKAAVIPHHVGKAEAINCAAGMACGEILVFTDARQMIEPQALKNLLMNFADPSVGCVSGELILETGDGAHQEGVGLYWRLEKKIREWESETGSVVGATGAFYAVRRELVPALAPGTILDDVFIPVSVARAGKRVLFEASARAHDNLPAESAREFNRKVRTLTGNYQLVQLAPWLLGPGNPLWLEYITHKFLRLIVPFALAGALASSLLLDGLVYRVAAVLQLLFYASAALALVRMQMGAIGRLGRVAYSFLLLNSAAVVALVNFLTGKKQVWVR